MVKDMQTMMNFCKSRGFMYQGSEIYGGIANVWDFGPLGCRLKNDIKDAWRKRYIQERENSYEIDAAILTHPKVWEASGHLSSFYDPKMDCKKCKTRFRADNFITDISKGEVNGDGLSYDEMEEYIEKNNIKCPVCGAHDFTKIRKFSQMFETYRGVTDEEKSIIYLRPENAQGEYINFLNVQRTTRSKLPFSVGQVGKAFRNEITPGNFNFRTIEFEQMEFQTFCKEGQDSDIYNYFKEYAKKYFVDLGLPLERLRFHNHEKLAHYAKEACDIEYLFPFGWGEINGTHNRTDYDLKRHQEYSGKCMEYLDTETNEKFIPSKKQAEKSKEILKTLSKEFMCTYDEAGTIGKRYRRQDEIGTPYCITIDYDTANDNCVTIRNRDTMEQDRINISEIREYINKQMDKFKI